MKYLFSIILFALTISSYAQERFVHTIPAPEGFHRELADGFGTYLRGLELLPEGSKVHLYDGSEKGYQDGAYAVIKMDVGDADLQQCADACIRLRAEFLYRHHQYSRIHFNFTNGFNAEYMKWAEGYRIRVDGNNASWYKTNEPNYGYWTFRKYLNMVYRYAGTASLAKETQAVSIKDCRIGDMFIRGGYPGHAMIIVDMAIDDKGNKAVLVAQSYMPAQEMHIVTNLENPDLSPWYILDESSDSFYFPEWIFKKNSIRRFTN